MRLQLVSVLAISCLAINTTAQDRYIFPDSANGEFLLSEAVDEAVIDSKRVLIFWGVNDSTDCHELDTALAADPKVAEVVEPEYTVIRVNSALNTELADALGVRIDRVPALSVVDPFQGLVAHRALAAPSGTEVLGFLYQHRAKPSQAVNYFDRARQAAGDQDKALFVLFTTEWCGWCKKLKETLGDPTVAPVIDQYLTYLEIDQEQMDGARALRYRLSGDTYGGIPWFTVVSPSGNVLTSPDGKRGIAGYPSGPHVSSLVAMVRRAAPDMTSQEQEELRTNLLRLTRFATRPNEPASSDAQLTIK